MRKCSICCVLVLIGVFLPVYSMNSNPAPEAEYDLFSFDLELTLPGSPETIFDAISGDISQWWDHSFSKAPMRLFIEPKPGGGFYEIFDSSGDGVLHATVIAAQRGKLLRFDGPLGLAGNAIQMVHTYRFYPEEKDRTRLTLSVRASGEMQKNLPSTVEKVWRHFLFDRFKPHVEAGKHLKK